MLVNAMFFFLHFIYRGIRQQQREKQKMEKNFAVSTHITVLAFKRQNRYVNVVMNSFE